MVASDPRNTTHTLHEVLSVHIVIPLSSSFGLSFLVGAAMLRVDKDSGAIESDFRRLAACCEVCRPEHVDRIFALFREWGEITTFESARRLLSSGTPPRKVAETLGVNIPTLYSGCRRREWHR